MFLEVIRFTGFKKQQRQRKQIFIIAKPSVFLCTSWFSYVFFKARCIYHSATSGRRSLVGINKSVLFVELSKGAV